MLTGWPAIALVVLANLVLIAPPPGWPKRWPWPNIKGTPAQWIGLEPRHELSVKMLVCVHLYCCPWRTFERNLF